MFTTPISARSLTILLFATAIGAAACKTSVIGGNSGGGGSGGEGFGGTGGGGGALIVGPPSAIAEYAYAQQPPEPGSTAVASAVSSGGGTTVDPNTLYVRIGNYGPTCGTGFYYACTTETTWQVSIGIPPDLQGAGTVVPLSALTAMFTETGSNGSPGDCWGGGGSFTEGTLEILSNDGATIVVRLTGGDAIVADVAVDGEYTAPICP